MEVRESNELSIHVSQTGPHNDFIHLDKNFYKGMRDELSQEYLKELSIFSKSIPQPECFGTYLNDEHYAKTLELMLKSTAETRHRGIFFKKIVLPALKEKRSLLDVGPGNGQLTRWVGNDFDSITLIDKNKALLDSFCIKETHTVLEKKYGSILDIKLKNNTYDLVLLSHLLYYINREEWLSVIKNAYDSLQPNGIIAIVLSGDQKTKAHLIQYFGGEMIDIDGLIKECFEVYGKNKVDIYSSDEDILTLDIDAMLHIAGFFLYDVGITCDSESLVSYLKKHCQLNKSDGRYVMSSNQKFILIHKR